MAALERPTAQYRTHGCYVCTHLLLIAHTANWLPYVKPLKLATRTPTTCANRYMGRDVKQQGQHPNDTSLLTQPWHYHQSVTIQRHSENTSASSFFPALVLVAEAHIANHQETEQHPSTTSSCQPLATNRSSSSRRHKRPANAELTAMIQFSPFAPQVFTYCTAALHHRHAHTHAQMSTRQPCFV